MLPIKKRYIVDDRNEPVAVQVDIATWARIEEALENRLLGLAMKKAEREEPLRREEALKYYHKLRKV